MNSYSVKLKHFAALMLMSLSILCYESTGSNKRRFKNKLHDWVFIKYPHIGKYSRKYNLVL
jgi:hypothetical protein